MPKKNESLLKKKEINENIVENWYEENEFFQGFDEEITQAWILKGFTKETAIYWLEDNYFDWEHSNYIAWLRDEQKITVSDWKKFDDNQIEELIDKYTEYWERNNFISCNHCAKLVDKNSILLFAYRKKNMFFCSTNCQQKYNASGQKWLEETYPKDGICQVDDDVNAGKGREEISQLNISEKNLAWVLDFSDFVNLEILRCWDNQLKELILINNEKLTELHCSYNQITELNLNNNPNLEELYCRNNEIIQLILPNFNRLVEINFSNNCLNYFNYACLNHSTLTYLRLDNNNLGETNLAVFSKLINLIYLNIRNYNKVKTNQRNKFIGSLSYLKELTKLEHLDIANTDINEGLEYLPLSLNYIGYNDEIGEELDLYGNNLAQWQAYHPELMRKAGKEVINLNDYNLELKWSIKIPWLLEGKLQKKAKKTNYREQFNYTGFLLRDIHPFSWENNSSLETKASEETNKFLYKPEEGNNFPENNVSGETNEIKNLAKILPTRLYQISTNQVIDSELLPSSVNYVILSYVWGDLSDQTNLTTWEYTYQNKEKVVENKQIGVNKEFGTVGTTRESIQALQKAISTLEFINKDLSEAARIDYLWMDQICINQFDNIEQGQEVPKMRQYYSNANSTFIAIDEEISNRIDKDGEVKLVEVVIKKIVSSQWFTRSWTFQEGILSKQTIFMFDDHLVDGRMLALVWGGVLGRYNNIPSTFVTPLGWSYGNQIDQVFGLNIGVVLEAVRNRQQSVAIDGIYAILGLLSYGDKVKVEYQPWGYQYTVNEIEEKLLELINQAYFHDPKEILTYLGERNPANWWLPIIYEDGLIGVYGNLNKSDSYDQHILSQIKEVTKQGIKLTGYLTVLDNKKIVEINRFDEEANSLLSETIQFVLSEKSDSITIEKVNEFYYSEKEDPQKIFIDMINREVITKKDNLLLYHQLASSPWTKVKLDLDKKNLSDSLDLSFYINLEKLDCKENLITEIILPYSDKLEKILCNDNLLSEIDVQNNPNLIQLEVSENQLKELDLSQNRQLVLLDCEENQLSALNLNNNHHLEKLICGKNQLGFLDLTCLVNLERILVDNNLLISFNYSTLNSTILTDLSFLNNNLPATDISVFSHLVNLEWLLIGNSDERKIQQNIYNRFYGSLVSFKDLTRLQWLHISNTDIDSGLEYLPNSVEMMSFSTKERPNCQLTIVEQQLKAQALNAKEYNPKHWKNYWTRFIKEKKEINSKIKELTELEENNQILSNDRTIIDDQLITAIEQLENFL